MHLPSFRNNHHRGFTLVEMLVIAPIAIITIAILVSMMVGLVGQTMLSTDRSSTTFNTQDALDRIEQDTKVSGAFLTTYNSVTAPQGRNGSTESFDTSKGDIIMSQQATTANPYNNTRQLVYFQNQPNPCSNATANRVLPVRIVYFTLSDGAGTNTLWRRTLMYSWNTNATPDGSTVCNAPWQRNSCPLTSTLNNTPCQAYDEKILENVSSFTTQYLLSNGTTTTDPTLAKTILVSLGSQRKVAGKQLVNTMSLRVTRGADIPVPPTPGTPTISVLNPAVQDYNNPILTTFQWSASNASSYLVSTSVNGGAWTTPQNVTGTSLGVDTQPGQPVSIKVTAYNDAGTSPTTTYASTAPLFNTMGLTNNWAVYSSTYYDPSYTKTSAGVVLLRGLVKNGTDSSCTPSTIAVLPVGFRPKYTVSYPVLSNGNSITNIAINANGSVMWTNCLNVAGANGWVSLDGIQFLATDAMDAIGTWDPFNSYPSSYWKPYVGGGGYRQDGLFFGIDSIGRAHAYGLITGSTSQPADYGTPAFLKSTYSPPAHLIMNSSNANGVYSYLYFLNASSTNLLYRLNGTDLRSLAQMYYPNNTNPGWTTPAMNSHWPNYGGGYDGASIVKAADNIVMMRGLISNTFGSAISSDGLFTAPSGYRPVKTMVFLVPSASTGVYARVDMLPTGAVNLNFASVPNGGWISLSSINFYPDG